MRDSRDQPAFDFTFRVLRELKSRENILLPMGVTGGLLTGIPQQLSGFSGVVGYTEGHLVSALVKTSLAKQVRLPSSLIK